MAATQKPDPKSTPVSPRMTTETGGIIADQRARDELREKQAQQTRIDLAAKKEKKP